VKIALNAGDNTYRNPNLPSDAIWYADMNARVTQSGDYLVRAATGGVPQTCYVAAQQPLLAHELDGLDPADMIAPATCLMGASGAMCRYDPHQAPLHRRTDDGSARLQLPGL
jgi:hypothetical protein